MKKIFRTTFALAAIAAIASCAEQIDSPVSEQGQGNADIPSSVEFVPMTFSTSADAEVESRTTYKKRNVYWEETDAISVFSVGSESVNSKGTVSAIDGADLKAWAKFTAPADPDAASYYAVYPYSETNACDAGGKLTVSIPSEQTAVVGGFMSGSNTSVAYSVPSAEGNVLQFRNIAALLCISFATDADAAATKSITIKAKKNDTEYWGLTGKGKVSFDTDKNLIIEEGDVQSVTLNAPDGSFVRESSYFIPVYAVGDITGLEVTYTGQDDKQYVKTNSNTATLERNVLFNIGAIADPYLPEVVTVLVDFTSGCPFDEGEYIAKENQKTSGDSYTYTYSYEIPGNQIVSKELPFLIADASSQSGVYDVYYCHSAAGLSSPVVDAKQADSNMANYNPDGRNIGISIRFPGISGRYLDSVEITAKSSQSSSMGRLSEVVRPTSSSVPLGTSWKFPITLSGNQGILDSKLGHAYYFVQRRANMFIQTIKLTYTKTKPEKS